MQNPYFTTAERAIFTRTIRAPRPVSLKAIVLAILVVLFVVAFALDHFTNLTSVPRTHAAESDVSDSVHQNDYYCNLLASRAHGQQIVVVGATVAQLKSVCPNLN